ncbi:MAG TPA: tryptophan synthase subunit alpha [bacterium]|nr:tryptophan synthase subunit alpha [bacterium]
MNRIANRLAVLRTGKRIGLMTHVVIGYPSLETSLELVKLMAEEGVDFVEMQLPFSDPVADGPTLMRANEAALSQGVTVADCLATIRRIRTAVDIPLFVMSYYNLLYNYGTERFCADAQAAGVDGLIIPDMPPDEEEREKLFALCDAHQLINSTFVSPACSDARLAEIAGQCRGFTYCFSTYGITGAREELDPRLPAYLQRVRRLLPGALAVGFGIKKHEHITALQGKADVAIVGSALLDAYTQAVQDNGLEAVRLCIRDLLCEND